MTYSQNIKDHRKSKYKFIMSKQGLIAYDKEKPITIRLNHEETNRLLNKNINFNKYDYFCEVAHLEISNRCNLHCEYCYVGNKCGDELDTAEWKYIIKNLARYGVFQVSFGGGEPTMRPDLLELASWVDKCSMNLGMTTNGSNMKKFNPDNLRRYFKQINISWHGSPDVFEEALDYLKKANIPRGINYCYSKLLAEDEDTVKLLAKEYDAELLYLVYKPVVKDFKNQILPEDVYKAAKISADEGLKVAVDGPCVNKCLMKRKFVDVDSLGNVYPCSFVRNPLGNLLKESFKKVWENRGYQDVCPYVKLNK
jgi:MoaA/NifB/PqqE/SkfB family radical SAM enzyme